jgi:hypothetical protein
MDVYPFRRALGLKSQLPSLLSAFPGKYMTRVLSHYQKLLEQAQLGRWQGAVVASGQFIEAVLKVLLEKANLTIAPSRAFKVNAAINQLKNAPFGTLDDSLRLTVPRACEYGYDIASNRGARHDPDEIDPNEMDASLCVSLCSWILGELLRIANKGASDRGEVADAISSLTERKYPSIETVNDRTYFHIKGLSAREIAVLLLWKVHPKRMKRESIIAGIIRHKFKARNAEVAVSRLGTVVDVDSAGFRLLQPGMEEADEIFRKRVRHGK